MPGHGPLLKNDAQVKAMAKLFAYIDEQVTTRVKRGEKIDQIRDELNLDSFRDNFAGESRIRKLIFRNYVVGPAVEAAYLDAVSTNSR